MGSDTELTTQRANNSGKSRQSKSFACHYEGCLNVYSRQWKLDRHICFHTKERPFKCNYPDCSKDYTSNSHLQRHITVSHKKTNVPIVHIDCPYPECNKHFQNKYSLKRHCKLKHIEKRDKYKCWKCEVEFKKKKQLIWHSREHRGPLLYSCSNCDASFESESQLTNHKRRRHKEYVCEYLECKEVFQVWSLLRKHYKVRHARKFVCDFCGHTFINKNTLTKHVLTHLDKSSQPAYPCPYEDCLRYYRYPSNLRHHIRTTHEGMRYKCTEENCTKVFKSKNRLMDHISRHKEGKLNLPRAPSARQRRPRKDMGLKKKSMAAKLSGVILPPQVDKQLAQNSMTAEAERTINCTIDLLKEVAAGDVHEAEEVAPDEAVLEKCEHDALNSLLYISQKTRLKSKC